MLTWPNKCSSQSRALFSLQQLKICCPNPVAAQLLNSYCSTLGLMATVIPSYHTLIKLLWNGTFYKNVFILFTIKRPISKWFQISPSSGDVHSSQLSTAASWRQRGPFIWADFAGQDVDQVVPARTRARSLRIFWPAFKRFLVGTFQHRAFHLVRNYWHNEL